MPQRISGIHHITVIASDPQRNLDFYTQTLGLRLVKLTVNFDDPATYHFYFGDETGNPGTILTFFPWTRVKEGRPGNGQVGSMSFSAPENAIGFWIDRLNKSGIDTDTQTRFGEEIITFKDPDGLQLEIISQTEAELPAGWASRSINESQALRGFHSLTLWEEGFEQTANLLRVMGFDQVAEDGARFRFQIPPTNIGGDAENQQHKTVDILCNPNLPPGKIGAGITHHVAWRTPDDDQQLAWREALRELGLNVTPVMDRNYFHSIYYREPGGVLFEIATDTPGFLIDETKSDLGSELKLPPWLEEQRDQIEKSLPGLKIPA